jgi:uncharacterized phage-like protein YoqJ
VKFPFAVDESDFVYINYINILYDTVKELAFDGYDLFLSGMSEGADIDFAYTVLFLRDIEELSIKLESVFPYPYKSRKIITEYSQDVETILVGCNYKTVISERYFKGCMQKRNRYMVDKSDLVLAIWNGKEEGGTWNTIKYARAKNKPIKYIMLDQIPPVI